MRKSLIIIIILTTLTVSVFSQKSVTKYYANGKVRLTSFVKNNTYDSTFISYYENEKKRAEGIFKKCTYKTNSTVIVQGTCGIERDTTEPSEGIRNGEWKYYFEDGQLKLLENYFCGIKVGQWIYYDSTGRVLINEFYNAGNLIQKQEYSKSGNLQTFITRTYKSSKKREDNTYRVTYQDLVLEYYPTGELKRIKTVNEDDEETGKHIEYWENGFVMTEGEYEKGIKNGIFREYYENGNTKFEGIFKNDVPVGNHYFSNEKGKNIKIETWNKGKLKKTENKSSS
jgi:antitoxin component YwqK of YwqJK toxin-antitoxin module